MTNELQKLLAASALIVTCEKIAASGHLPEADERALRLIIARCCKAFNMPSIAERPFNDPTYLRTIESVAREMGI